MSREPLISGSDPQGDPSAAAEQELLWSLRPTFIYLSELTLAGLRKAFEEYQDFVKFPSELERELGQ